MIFEDEDYNGPVVLQWEEYRYEPIIKCQCRATEHGHNIIGIAEAQDSMMICHECPIVATSLDVM